MEFYTADIAGRKEDLPVMEIGENLKIAFFNLHGAQELTEYCAVKLAEKIRGTGAEVVMTAESKGLQLAHCVARELGQKYYAVARKSKKLYMQDGISATVKSITTAGEQTLYLSKHDADLIKGKKVAIVDDVISTGGSLKGLEELARQEDCEVVCRAFVLAEGAEAEREDVVYLGVIPLL